MVMFLDVNELIEFIKLSIKNGTYDMVPTSKNRESKRKFGLTQLDIEYFIYSLEKEDLYKGPEFDRDYPNEELFIFKKEIIEGTLFYVKVKYKNKQIKILSCHLDE